jgi:Zn finger protein HypA/HybF involved in hydrogenase expression
MVNTMSRKFQRTIEDFTCLHCHKRIKGNGYTNHCPHCLWSKHVDIHPGDRLNTCQGLMEPVQAFYKGGQWNLIHRCQKCHTEKTIKIFPGDNIEPILNTLQRQILT